MDIGGGSGAWIFREVVWLDSTLAQDTLDTKGGFVGIDNVLRLPQMLQK